MNITIGEKKTFDDWGLKLLKVSVGFPELKTDLVNLPGADGVIDLTEALGAVRYGTRSLEFVFDAPGDPKKWHGLTSEIANYLHGKRLKVILDSDPDYYYIGRLSISSEKSSYLINRLVITGEMEPYKNELYSGLERWKWDTFSLRSGIIRNYRDLQVDGSRSVKIAGRKREVVPVIICSAALEVEWRGVRYGLSAGKNKIYEISIPEGENVLTFYGQGTVSIDYRGGTL